jgi:hypothetical protein
MKNAPDLWFKRKRYGYGWVPVTWQGWLLLAAYVAMITAVAPFFLRDAGQHLARALIRFYAFVIPSAIVFILLVRSRAPKGRWRWGRKPDDDPGEDL